MTTVAENAVDKKADKLAKMIALAEAASTQEERDNAMKMVHERMAAWGVEQARIDARKAKGQTEPLVELATDVIKGSWNAPYEMLINGLAGAGQMRILQRSHSYGKDKGGTTYFLLGFESDVEQAMVLFASLRAQAEIAVKEAARDREFYRYAYTAGEKYKARRDFMFGFVSGALAKIRDARATALAEAKAQDEEIMAATTAADLEEDENRPVGAELAIASKLEKVEDFVSEKYPVLGKARTKRVSIGDFGGYSTGVAAGRRANVGTSKGIGTGPGQLK